jgi:3-methylcrotonyl-CoA carboxylase alpha subunit
MGAAAVEAAKAVGYVGAGTVEFISHPDGRFYFMEMNTRLQVEHPVTEMITGLDLVEWQLRVAAGEPLPRRQDELAIHGHAIEARVYAEDPDRGFLPSTGRLVHLAPPPESASVRVDTGVEQGDAITPFYDPMIAKLIVHGADRAAALARMKAALETYRIVGVANNIEFLARLMATGSFVRADLDTALIEREHDALFPAATLPPEEVWLLAALAEVERDAVAARQHGQRAADPGSPWRTLDGWRLNGRAVRRLGWRIGDTMREVDVGALPGGAWELPLEGTTIVATTSLLDDRMTATLGTRRLTATVVAHGDRRHVFLAGHVFVLTLVDLLGVGGAEHDEEGAGLLAPMPGKVIALLARPGGAVEKGAPLLVLEAMKMEHTITAPRAGTVKGFRYAAGDQVAEGAELVDFE